MAIVEEVVPAEETASNQILIYTNYSGMWPRDGSPCVCKKPGFECSCRRRVPFPTAILLKNSNVICTLCSIEGSYKDLPKHYFEKHGHQLASDYSVGAMGRVVKNRRCPLCAYVVPCMKKHLTKDHRAQDVKTSGVGIAESAASVPKRGGGIESVCDRCDQVFSAMKLLAGHLDKVHGIIVVKKKFMIRNPQQPHILTMFTENMPNGQCLLK